MSKWPSINKGVMAEWMDYERQLWQQYQDNRPVIFRKSIDYLVGLSLHSFIAHAIYVSESTFPMDANYKQAVLDKFAELRRRRIVKDLDEYKYEYQEAATNA